MNSTTAFIAFSAFIVAGFMIDRRGRRAPVSAATWLPVFWMAICASRSIGQWLGVTNYKVMYASDAEYMQANLAGSAVDRNVLTLMIVIAIGIICKRRAFADVIKRNKTLMVFVLYLGISVLWSDTVDVSFKRWIRIVGHVAMAGLLMSEQNPLEAVRAVFRRCAYLLIPLSVMLIKYFPNIGVLYFRKGDLFWIGAAVMKNGLGHIALVFTFIVIWELITSRTRTEPPDRRKQMYDAAVMVMGLWLLRGPDGANGSAAGLGALIAASAILVSSRVRSIGALFRNSGVVVVIVAAVFVILESSVGIVEMVVAALGRDMTFTDRVPMWSVLVEMGSRYLLFGYGYNGFWTEDRIAAVSAIAGDFNQAHNGYLELFVEGGVVGMVLLTLMVGVVFWKIQKTSAASIDFGVLRLCFLMIVLIANVTESAFARERDLVSFVFFMIAMNDSQCRSVAAAATASLRSAIGKPPAVAASVFSRSPAGVAARCAMTPRR